MNAPSAKISQKSGANPHRERYDMNEFLFDKHAPIKGYPELRWAGKRPFTGTCYYPAQLKDSYGSPSDSGWMNRIYWGDNLQVMSHLLKEFRGKVDLIYIDPPFDSKAEYKKAIKLRGRSAESDTSTFEEKQYGDIWTNDEYLQFMYERLILCRELLSDTGSLYVHMDEKRSHYVKIILDEVFGSNNFRREIVWDIQVLSGYKTITNNWVRGHDIIFYYSKSSNRSFNKQKQKHRQEYLNRFNKIDETGRKYFDGRGTIVYLDDAIEKGKAIGDVWSDIMSFQQLATSTEKLGYPTQKPEALLERIIKASSNPGDIIFDCFMGSGTTQAVAMKLGRRFIGADINVGAVHTTTKRLINCAKELKASLFSSNDEVGSFYTGFEVYNVNDYNLFRNELEAKDLIIEALGMQKLPESKIWDAEFDGRMVAILGINRVATASEFEYIIANIDVRTWMKRQQDNINHPVEKITFVCMGHDPNLKAMFEDRMYQLGFKVDLEIIDLRRDKKDLRFKREADASVSIKNGKLSIDAFYPMNLLQKLSFDCEDVDDWRELVDAIFIDWHYDGVTFSPELTDIPDARSKVVGCYDIPKDAGRIHIRITDLISESWTATFDANGEKL